jgi:cell division protein FtsI (penicillin-binding protein 3)
MDIKKDILWRVYIVYILVVIFAFIIIGKVFYIQVFEGEELKLRSKELTIDTLKVDAMRGDICADDGSLLATSVPIFEIRIDFVSIEDDYFRDNLDSLSYCLSNLFKDKSKNEYKMILSKAKQDDERYFLLKRGVNYTQLKALRKFPVLRGGRYKGGKMEIQKYHREMPYKTLAARTIGFDRAGIYVGLEGAYSKKLEGISGLSLKQKIAGGVWMPINDDNEVEPLDGSDIITTINVNMQDLTENALMKSLILNNAHHGCAVLMEVETGEIKAIANLTKAKDGSYEEKYNYAVGESTEPGSTFKLASIMAALEDGLVNLSDTVNTGDGSYTYFNQKMIDAHRGYGRISAEKAFEVSSNVGISKLIYKAYSKNPQKFIDRLYNMNLNVPLGLDIDGEGMPDIKDTKSSHWSRVSLPWMSVGYELRLTPLQILAFYNAVANNGKLMKPIFVKEIRRLGKVTDVFHPCVINEAICSKPTIDKAHTLLEGVVEKGTARNIRSTVYKIAGKTGTAQVARGKFGYDQEKGVSYKASFVGYFPADNPKYSCIVVINNPTSGAYYGGSVSAPVFKEISDRVYATVSNVHQETNDSIEHAQPSYVKSGSSKDINTIYSTLHLPQGLCNPQYFWVSTVKNKKEISYVEKQISYATIPEVIGMTAKDAMFILENMGLKVKLVGRGKVISQSEKPGSRAEVGREIILNLAFKPGLDSSFILRKVDTLNGDEKSKDPTNEKDKNSDKQKDKQKDKHKDKLNKDAAKPKNNHNIPKDKVKDKSNNKPNNPHHNH